MHYTLIESPLGPVLVAGDPEGLRHIHFQDGNRAFMAPADWIRDERPLAEATRQLRAYFAGTLTDFDLPLAPKGTAFQQRVWRALREIPYGTTLSYGALAERIGRPTASRAVGAANGRNPLPIVVPCHRVIGSTGSLTGFAGGLHLKAGLLALEGVPAMATALADNRQTALL